MVSSSLPTSWVTDSADALTTAARSSRLLITSLLNRCFKTPKHQSSANFVCLGSKMESLTFWWSLVSVRPETDLNYHVSSVCMLVAFWSLTKASTACRVMSVQILPEVDFCNHSIMAPSLLLTGKFVNAFETSGVRIHMCKVSTMPSFFIILHLDRQ